MTLARIALPTLVTVLGSAVTLFLFRADASYFFEPRTPRDLGEATAALDAKPATNSHVRMRGIADLSRSVRVGRRGGDARIARLSASPLLIEVPAAGAPGTRPSGEGGLTESGFFDGAGRLFAAADLPSSYAPILRRFQEGGPVRYVLVAGESPNDAWLGFVASLGVALFALLACVFALRAMRRARKEASRGAA